MSPQRTSTTMELLPLVCLCLLSCSGDAVRVLVEEDSDAVLNCSLSTEDLEGKFFDWKKDGQKEVFLYDAGNHYNNGRPGQDEQFKGRVEHFQDQLQNGDASIKIRRTKMDDSGNYSCDFPRLQPRQTFYIELVVDPRVKVAVEGGSDAVLNCSISTKEDLTEQVFDWKKGSQDVFIHYSNRKTREGPDFTGRVSHFQDQLQNGNASIKITNTKMDDSGIYSCIFPNLQSQTFYMKLVVGASEPSVNTLITDDGMVLQCKVKGASPKPKVEWKDSSGNILPVKDLKETESGGIILRAAVTKTDTFRCVVTQEEIGHQTEAETYAAFNVPPPKSAVRVLVERDGDAVLPCLVSTKESLTRKLFDWKKDGQKEVFLYDAGNHYNNGRYGQDEQFIGRVSHFQDQLQNGNASIKITRTKMADSGIYSCDFPRLQPSQTFYIELVVVRVLRDRTGEAPGAAPEPCIRTLDDNLVQALLQCEAHGDPRPTLKWEDSAGNTLHAEKPQTSERRRYSYVTVNITVTRTNNYRCVATQETLSHQIAAVTSVYIQGWSGWWIVGFIVVSLLLVGAVMFHFKDRISQICAKDPGSTPVATEGKTDDEQRNKMMENQSTP